MHFMKKNGAANCRRRCIEKYCLSIPTAKPAQTGNPENDQGNGRWFGNHRNLDVINRHLLSIDRTASIQLPAVELPSELIRLVRRIKIAATKGV
jgi:hypothetical protein